MNTARVFMDYAQAFETTYKDDVWSRLGSHFTASVVYLTSDGTEVRGRDQVVAYLEESVNALDRRFDSRDLEVLSEPEVSGPRITVNWMATYKKRGLPDLVLSGTETALVEGEKISRLEDSLCDGVERGLQTWMREHGEGLS